jgi:hypothetical protein
MGKILLVGNIYEITGWRRRSDSACTDDQLTTEALVKFSAQ